MWGRQKNEPQHKRNDANKEDSSKVSRHDEAKKSSFKGDFPTSTERSRASLDESHRHRSRSKSSERRHRSVVLRRRSVDHISTDNKSGDKKENERRGSLGRSVFSWMGSRSNSEEEKKSSNEPHPKRGSINHSASSSKPRNDERNQPKKPLTRRATVSNPSSGHETSRYRYLPDSNSTNSSKNGEENRRRRAHTNRTANDNDSSSPRLSDRTPSPGFRRLSESRKHNSLQQREPRDGYSKTREGEKADLFSTKRNSRASTKMYYDSTTQSLKPITNEEDYERVKNSMLPSHKPSKQNQSQQRSNDNNSESHQASSSRTSSTDRARAKSRDRSSRPKTASPYNSAHRSRDKSVDPEHSDRETRRSRRHRTKSPPNRSSLSKDSSNRSLSLGRSSSGSRQRRRDQSLPPKSRDQSLPPKSRDRSLPPKSRDQSSRTSRAPSENAVRRRRTRRSLDMLSNELTGLDYFDDSEIPNASGSRHSRRDDFDLSLDDLATDVDKDEKISSRANSPEANPRRRPPGSKNEDRFRSNGANPLTTPVQRGQGHDINSDGITRRSLSRVSHSRSNSPEANPQRAPPPRRHAVQPQPDVEVKQPISPDRDAKLSPSSSSADGKGQEKQLNVENPTFTPTILPASQNSEPRSADASFASRLRRTSLNRNVSAKTDSGWAPTSRPSSRPLARSVPANYGSEIDHSPRVLNERLCASIPPPPLSGGSVAPRGTAPVNTSSSRNNMAKSHSESNLNITPSNSDAKHRSPPPPPPPRRKSPTDPITSNAAAKTPPQKTAKKMTSEERVNHLLSQLGVDPTDNKLPDNKSPNLTRSMSANSLPNSDERRGVSPAARRTARRIGGSKVKDLPYTDQAGDSGLYTGDVDEDGRPHGKGKMKYDNGIFFTGNWVNGAQDPDALKQRERIYSGFSSWKSSAQSKDKSMAGGSRHVYGMDWVDFSGKSGRYTGSVNENDIPDGNGVMRYDFGLIAEGTWIKGVLNDGAPSNPVSGAMSVYGGASAFGGASVYGGASVVGGSVFGGASIAPSMFGASYMGANMVPGMTGPAMHPLMMSYQGPMYFPPTPDAMSCVQGQGAAPPPSSIVVSNE